jgi:type IV pilus assembly protein PilX
VNGSKSSPYRRQDGATLIAVLLILLVVLLFGAASAQMALQGERMERNERDRRIAFEAAEAALVDAEMDIDASEGNATRSTLFSRYSAIGFPVEAGACASGAGNRYLGMCRPAADGATAVWRSVDFEDTAEATVRTVAYGQFTGQRFPLGAGMLPARSPRYIIELLPDRREGDAAERNAYVYRITAVGYGANQNTQVALQAIYRKAR